MMIKPRYFKDLRTWFEDHPNEIVPLDLNMKIFIVVTSKKNAQNEYEYEYEFVTDENSINEETAHTGSSDCIWIVGIDALMAATDMGTNIPMISISADGTCHYWQS